MQKTILIRASHVLTNRSTSRTSGRFTSESGWDQVYFASVWRIMSTVAKIELHKCIKKGVFYKLHAREINFNKYYYYMMNMRVMMNMRFIEQKERNGTWKYIFPFWQKLIFYNYLVRGSWVTLLKSRNPWPTACEADVITTTPTKLVHRVCGN